ncbi:MAG TPA: lytic transglycosylase domain-containing protein, partial [Xanthobacteraceae bacterium]|nr:lytic transglycosylase domain-containing protein [Xanthobacteraceae bacterium]
MLVSREKRTATAWALLTLSLAMVLPLAAESARSAPASETKPAESASKATAKSSTKKTAPHAKSEIKAETKSKAEAKSKSETKSGTKPGTKSDTKSSTKAAAASPSKAVDKGRAAAASHPKSAARPTGPNTRPAPSPHRTPASPPTQATVHPSAPIAALAYAAPATAGIPLAAATTAWTSPADIDAVRQAVGLIQAGRGGEAGSVERGISDPLARKLVEWMILRSDETDADFARYHAFIAANPGWPSIVTFRRRAEAMLWQERAPPATVRAYFAGIRPLSPKGRFALARALLLDGDRAGAQAFAREAWRADSFSQDLENQALELFGDLITRADDKARMDRRLYAADEDAGLRAAKRLGGDQPAIAKARIAVNVRAGNAKTLLDEVPVAARNDAGYIFSAVQWLRRHDRFADAAALLMRAPRDPAQLQDVDEWWVERRLVARKLLDLGDPRLAYAIVRDAAKPAKDNYRAEHQFTAGWIALRFLKEPAIAAQHFARVAEGNANPITISRAGYWLGRTAELADR